MVRVSGVRDRAYACVHRRRVCYHAPAPMRPAPRTATVLTGCLGLPYLLCFSAVVPVGPGQASSCVQVSKRNPRCTTTNQSHQPHSTTATPPVKMPRRAPETEVAASSAKRVASYSSACSSGRFHSIRFVCVRGSVEGWCLIVIDRCVAMPCRSHGTHLGLGVVVAVLDGVEDGHGGGVVPACRTNTVMMMLYKIGQHTHTCTRRV